MIKLLLVVAGGALGSAGRYALAGFMHRVTSTVFPIGTLLVNLIGSLIIGFLWGLFENSNITPHVRSFLFIGVLGGFTTFSSYSLETLNLLRDGQFKLAILNFLLNNLLGIVLAFAGFALSRQLHH
jgi:fluoride exporter